MCNRSHGQHGHADRAGGAGGAGGADADHGVEPVGEMKNARGCGRFQISITFRKEMLFEYLYTAIPH